MQIEQRPSFQRAMKKLQANQLNDLNHAITMVVENPTIGQLKTGDLRGLRTYKFRMVKQLTLLGYTWDKDVVILTLLAFGPHENFYRDLKNQL